MTVDANVSYALDPQRWRKFREIPFEEAKPGDYVEFDGSFVWSEHVIGRLVGGSDGRLLVDRPIVTTGGQQEWDVLTRDRRPERNITDLHVYRKKSSDDGR